MIEENTSEAVPTVVSPKPGSPKIVREAEHKLKEMSKRAKERKTAQNPARQKSRFSEINYF